MSAKRPQPHERYQSLHLFSTSLGHSGFQGGTTVSSKSPTKISLFEKDWPRKGPLFCSKSSDFVNTAISQVHSITCISSWLSRHHENTNPYRVVVPRVPG